MKRSKCIALLLVASVAGGHALALSAADWFSFRPFKARSQTPESDDSSNTLSTTVETPMVGEYTRVSGLNFILLEGVGLVIGLDGTGGDPPPSTYTQQLLDEMRRRGIKNPNQILRSQNTALVAVRAYLPPLVKEKDRFDVQVRLLPGDTSTSLNGGWLMATRLTEHAIVPGQGVLKGHVYGVAEGPILASMGEGDPALQAGVLRRGEVLAGGVAMKGRDMALFLRSDFKSVRNAKRIADRIGQRFYRYDQHGLREPLAEAKTDEKVELKILDRYKDNYPRFLQVVGGIAFRETEVAERVRMQKLKDELNTPETAEHASLRLEAIGSKSIPILKTGLENPSLEVRFHSALALAYLGDPSGLSSLAEAARKEPAFRIFAFAAMSAIDDAEAHVQLRELMDDDPSIQGSSSETRYGAFRALSTLDPNDPFIRGEHLDKEGRINFHVLDTTGAPMVHLTTYRKSEIVLFGADQEFRLPIAVRAGSKILITGTQGGDTISVARYEPGEPDQRKEVSTKLRDVIRAVADLGASYPDLAQMLVQADRQHNLPGRLEIDALPQSGRLYVRPQAQDGDSAPSRTRVGNPKMAPNLFEGKRGDEESRPADSESGIASAADATPIGEEALIRSAPWYDIRRWLKPDAADAE